MKYFLLHCTRVTLLIAFCLLQFNKANGQQPLPYDFNLVVKDLENVVPQQFLEHGQFHSASDATSKTGSLHDLWVSADENGNYVIKDYFGIQDSTETVFWLDNVHHSLAAYHNSTALWKVNLDHHWVTIHNGLIHHVQLRGKAIWIYGFHCCVEFNRVTGREGGGGCD